MRGQRKIADFIEEYRPAVGRAKQPGLVAHGTGERPFDVSEEMTLDEARGDRSAIDRDEVTPSRRALVDRAGQQLFPRARLASDEDRDFGARETLERFELDIELRIEGHVPALVRGAGDVDIGRCPLGGHAPQHETKEDTANGDRRSLVHDRARDARAVDERPVRAAAVFDHPIAAGANQASVGRRGGGRCDPDVERRDPAVAVPGRAARLTPPERHAVDPLEGVSSAAARRGVALETKDEVRDRACVLVAVGAARIVDGAAHGPCSTADAMPLRYWCEAEHIATTKLQTAAR